MDDLISRKQAIEALKEHRALYCDNTPDTFSKLSYAEKSRVDELDTAIATLVNLPSAQPKTGRWINKGVFGGDDIEEWQECQCSECGRWDTRPYMYYFSEPNYCSYCGAKMQKGEANASTNS